MLPAMEYKSPLKLVDTTSAAGKQKPKEAIELAADYILGKYELRKNSISKKVEYFEKETGQLIHFDQDTRNGLMFDMLSSGYKVNKAWIDIIIDNKRHYTLYNPVLNFITGLPAWDGTDHIAALSKTVTVADESAEGTSIKALWPVFLQRWLVASIACMQNTMNDSSRVINEWCLTLTGEGGTGKTRWLLRLITPMLEKLYFRGKLPLSSNNEKTIHMLTTKAIILLDDQLQTMRDWEFHNLKDIIDARFTENRGPWADYFAQNPRIASFCAATDINKFLTDKNNRRFLVFTVENLQYEHSVNIDQVWAQALHLYKAGERFWFNEDESRQLNAINQIYRAISVEEEILTNIYRPHNGQDNPDELLFFQPTQLLKDLQKHTKEILKLNKVTDALKAAKFVYSNKWIAGKKQGVYGYYLIKNEK